MANPINAVSGTATIPAVNGENEASGGIGIFGSCDTGHGVRGKSKSSQGVVGVSESYIGVHGSSVTGRGVWGESKKEHGVFGQSTDQAGVLGVSENFAGIMGESHNNAHPGVFGKSEKAGVHGESTKGQGVFGGSNEQAGVVGVSQKFVGVWGESKSDDQPGVFGLGKIAGRFDGDVEVTGDIKLTHADFAEDFDVAEQTEPGEVMVLTDTGILQQSTKAYDRKVVGVISGAGNYKPGIILDKQNCNGNRKPIAMMGKVFCKVDADISSIETGDMLTSSNVAGCAMKAIDPSKAFGAVIGKALAPLQSGKGLIPILVVLQ